MEPLEERVVGGGHDTGKHVVVAGEDLRRRVQDDVATLLERADAERRSHRRVADDGSAVRHRGLEVRHRQDRVRRRLDQHEVGPGRWRSGLIELDEAQTPRCEVEHELRVTVVGGLSDGDRRAGVRHREQDSGDGAHPGREEQRPPAVERAERFFARHARRMVVTRVRETARRPVLVGPGRRAVETCVHARNATRLRSCGETDTRATQSRVSLARGSTLRSRRGEEAGGPGDRLKDMSETGRVADRDSGDRIGSRPMSTRHETTEAKLRWLAELRAEVEHAGSEQSVVRQRERGKLLARERIERLVDPGSFVELDRFVRHRETEFGMAREPAVGRRRRHRLRDGLRANGVRLLAGLHRLRRLAVGGVRGEGLQGDGHGGHVRLPGDRDQRLGRCADPGRRRLAGRLRGDLLAQRAGIRGRAADLARAGAVRGRAPSTRLRSPTSCS